MDNYETLVKAVRTYVTAMNEYSFFMEGYTNGSASISEFYAASDKANAASAEMQVALRASEEEIKTIPPISSL